MIEKNDGAGKEAAGDASAALEQCRKSAAQGDTKAQYNLGYYYAYGRGVAQDYAEALNWYGKSAAQKNADAQCSLGYMHDRGLGVPVDHAEAFKWYELAAAQGHANAQYNLGYMYFHGSGVTLDLVKSARWHEKAAAQGVPDAQCTLGYMYDSGQGVAQNYEEAMKWYKKAAAQGSASGYYNVGSMHDTGRGVRSDFAEAIKWYQKAADLGHAKAQCYLGHMYSKGEGTAQNTAVAMQWYEKSAAQGFAEAQTSLKALQDKPVAAAPLPPPEPDASKMHDVATYSRVKLAIKGISGILFGTIVLSVFALSVWFTKDNVENHHGSWGLLVMSIFPLCLGYFVFSGGLRHLEAAFARDCWLKASPEGISIRLPCAADRKTLFLTNRMIECVIPWADVLKLYMVQYRINGIPSGKELVIKTRTHGTFHLGSYFRERADLIQLAIKSVALQQ